MSRPSNTEERRAQIVEGLRKVMAVKGYEGASIAEIASAAGLTTGLVHYHFKDKREILLRLLDQIVEKQRSRLERRIEEAAPDAWARVGAFLDCHLALGQDQDPEALACWILIGGEALRQEAVKERFARALESLTTRLRALIEEGVEAGTLACPEPAAAAAALMSLIQGYYSVSAANRPLIPSGSAIHMARRMAAALLGAPPIPKKPRQGPEAPGPPVL